MKNFERTQYKKTVDQNNHTFDVWEKNDSGLDINLSSLGWKPADQFSITDLESRLMSAQVMTIAIGNSDFSKNLIQHILNVVKNPKCKARIYLYAPQALDSFLIQVQKRSPVEILIRLGKCPPADWIIFDHDAKGILIIGQTNEDRSWVIPTDLDLIRTLNQAFCILFWFNASHEAFGSTKSHLEFNLPLPHPFPAPPTTVEHTLHEGQLVFSDSLRPALNSQIQIVPQLNAEVKAPFIITPPNGQTDLFQAAISLSQSGCQLLWFPHKLPPMAITTNQTAIDLIGSDCSLRIFFSKKHTITIKRLFDKMCNKPKWRFYLNREFGHVEGLVVTENANVPKKMKDEIVLDLPTVQMRLAHPSPLPQEWPTPDDLTKKIIYRWFSEPLSLPDASLKEPLYRNWLQTDDWARSCLNTIQEEITAIKKASLSPEMNNILHDLDLERLELGDIDPSQNMQDANAQILRIKSLCDALIDFKNNVHQHNVEQRQNEIAHYESLTWQARIPHYLSSPQEKEAAEKIITEITLLKEKTEHDHSKKLKQAIQTQEARLMRLLPKPQVLSPRPQQLSFDPPPPTPTESLPSVGELYTHHGQRYLAIVNPNQVPQGETESFRLGAKLVAKAVITPSAQSLSPIF